jgi:predicted TIM-barrel fold metal-dependent hydrolase
MPDHLPATYSRRAFMAVAGAASCLAKEAFSAAKKNEAGWIDAHVHVWTPDTNAYPLDKAFKREDMQPKSFTPAELFAHTKPSGVARVVLIQMSYYRFDNRYMLDVIAEHPGVFSGVGIVDHHSADVSANMKQLAKKGVRGFRIHAQGDEAAKWIDDDGMATLWKTAREEELAVCPLINPTDLPHIDTLCKKFSDTCVVVDHFARIGMRGEIVADQLEQLCKLARYPNVYVKTSAFYALGKKQPPYTDLLPMIRRVVEAFTPQRIMWASDCPFQVQEKHTYADSIALIRDQADFLSPEDKQAILRGTAEKVFFGKANS